jgi:hypothetical protein
VNALCPDRPLEEKKDIARRILDLCSGEAQPAIKITPAQVQDIVWRNLQCVHRQCPMLLFSWRIAEELNQFFAAKE